MFVLIQLKNMHLVFCGEDGDLCERGRALVLRSRDEAFELAANLNACDRGGWHVIDVSDSAAICARACQLITAAMRSADNGTHASCDGCRNYLGSGQCRVNLEAECAAGGYEAYEG